MSRSNKVKWKKINFLPIVTAQMVCLLLKGSFVSGINLYFHVTTRVQPATFGGHDFLVIDPPFEVAHIQGYYFSKLFSSTWKFTTIYHLMVMVSQYLSNFCVQHYRTKPT